MKESDADGGQAQMKESGADDEQAQMTESGADDGQAQMKESGTDDGPSSSQIRGDQRQSHDCHGRPPHWGFSGFPRRRPHPFVHFGRFQDPWGQTDCSNNKRQDSPVDEAEDDEVDSSPENKEHRNKHHGHQRWAGCGPWSCEMDPEQGESCPSSGHNLASPRHPMMGRRGHAMGRFHGFRGGRPHPFAHFGRFHRRPGKYHCDEKNCKGSPVDEFKDDAAGSSPADKENSRYRSNHPRWAEARGKRCPMFRDMIDDSCEHGMPPHPHPMMTPPWAFGMSPPHLGPWAQGMTHPHPALFGPWMRGMSTQHPAMMGPCGLARRNKRKIITVVEDDDPFMGIFM